MRGHGNQHIFDIMDEGLQLVSTIKPSDWNEKFRIMSPETSPFPGPFRYDRSPYLVEIVNRLSPDDPANQVTFKKGAQIGGSVGVIEAGIGWIISENPGNILFLSGHQELSEEMMNLRIDQMIDSTGLRPKIRPNVIKKKNQRTGDTGKSKEFAGGGLVAGSASNHALLAQRSVRYAFIDDYDDVKGSSKSDGNTTALIKQRLAAYFSKMKIFWISTPRVASSSNIDPLYLEGDQRLYNVPCPNCGAYIPLKWVVSIEGTDDKEKGGITWKMDGRGRLIAGSVEYICQCCAKGFDDSKKYEMNLAGIWMPTAEASEPGHYSYHMPSLYAPPGAYDWEYYVRQYLKANPPGGSRKEDEHQTFMNLCLGETYEPAGEELKANDLQKNIRKYEIGLLPEKLSLNDGNGLIVLLTCACDLNGTVEDARLDWELVAWTETGSSYSVKHGSIGTFVPREGSKKIKEDRERWTYKHKVPNSVWPELSKILSSIYETDTGRKMRILQSGVDCGHYSEYAYPYIDNSNLNVVGLKGRDESKPTRLGLDLPYFRPARERANLFLVEVNTVKDVLADHIRLKWNPGYDEHQPPSFINFPVPSGGLYLFDNYFEHFEAEHRVVHTKDEKGVGFHWVKKSSNKQNHFWDVRVYNMALKEIITADTCKALGIKNFTWNDFVEFALKMIKPKNKS